MEMNLSKLWEIVKDYSEDIVKDWCAAVHGVAKRRDLSVEQ